MTNKTKYFISITYKISVILHRQIFPEVWRYLFFYVPSEWRYQGFQVMAIVSDS